MRDIEEQILNLLGYILLGLIVICPTLRLALVDEEMYKVCAIMLFLIGGMCLIFAPFAVMCCRIESVFINKELDEYNQLKTSVQKNADLYNEQLDKCIEMKELYDSQYAGKSDDESLQFYYKMVTITAAVINCKDIIEETIEEMNKCQKDVSDKIEDLENRYSGFAVIDKNYREKE